MLRSKRLPSSIFLTGVSVTSPTLLTGNLSIPIGTSAGTYNGRVFFGPGCTSTIYSCTSCFTISAAPASIIGITPNNADPGEGINNIVFTGINTNFTANTNTVQILSSPSTITLTDVNVTSTTSLNADISVPANTTPGTYGARIYEGPGTSGASYTCSNCFTINTPDISFSPSSGTENTSFGVTVTGNNTNFNASTTCVEIKASPSSIFLTGVSVTSPTLLTGTLSIPIGTVAGTYDATAYFGPGCTSTEYDCFSCFTISAAPASIITISPNNADPGESINNIDFTGINSNFNVNTTVVEILASPSTITLTDVNVTSTTALNADISVPSSTTPGTYGARIYEGPGTSGASYTCNNCFTINTPDISFSPNSGTENTSFGVTVTGNNTSFNASTTCVEIKASPSSIFLTGVSVTSPTLLTGTLSIPIGTAAGTYDATAYFGPGCTSTEYDCFSCFTISAAPASIITISPNNADPGESVNNINFTGINSNFNVNTTVVEILASPSTITLTDVNVTSTTALNADISVPSNTTPGTYGARIYEGPGTSGASYTCNNCFTINTPDISFSPNSGTENTSFGVTVTGNNTSFNASTTCVEIKASPSSIFLTGVSVTSPTLLTGTLSIPIGTSAGTYDATVYFGPGCTSTEYDCFSCFTISAATPAIVSISPNNADPGQSINNIDFTGINSNFNVNTTVVEILASPSTITLTDVNVTSTTALNADISVPSNTTPGTYGARIYEGPGTSGASYTCNNCFTINTPDISFSPNSGTENTSFGVTVTGNNTSFNASTTCVEIKASPSSIFLTGVSVTSPTLLTGTLSIPIGTSAGTYDATVYFGPGCTSTEYDCFSCFTISAATPAIIGITPNDADPGQSINNIVFTGINTNFNVNTTVVEILSSPSAITLTDVNVSSTTSLDAGYKYALLVPLQVFMALEYTKGREPQVLLTLATIALA